MNLSFWWYSFFVIFSWETVWVKKSKFHKSFLRQRFRYVFKVGCKKEFQEQWFNADSNQTQSVLTLELGSEWKEWPFWPYTIFRNNAKYLVHVWSNQKSLYSNHISHFWLFCKLFGDFCVYLAINSFSQKIRKFWRFDVVLKLEVEVRNWTYTKQLSGSVQNFFLVLTLKNRKNPRRNCYC